MATGDLDYPQLRDVVCFETPVGRAWGVVVAIDDDGKLQVDFGPRRTLVTLGLGDLVSWRRPWAQDEAAERERSLQEAERQRHNSKIYSEHRIRGTWFHPKYPPGGIEA